MQIWRLPYPQKFNIQQTTLKSWPCPASKHSWKLSHSQTMKLNYTNQGCFVCSYSCRSRDSWRKPTKLKYLFSRNKSFRLKEWSKKWVLCNCIWDQKILSETPTEASTTQGHPTTVFLRWNICWRSKNCLEFSIAWGRLKISRWPFHSRTIFEAYLINSRWFSEV